MSLFYKEFGRAEIGGIIVVQLNMDNTASVVMSSWPGSGNKLNVIDCGHMRVGVIQFALKQDPH